MPRAHHPGQGTQRGGGARAGGNYFWWTVGLFAAAVVYGVGGFTTLCYALSTKFDQANAVFDDLQCCTCHACDERAALDSADARTSQVDSCSAKLFGDEDALLDYCLNEYGRVVVDGMEYTLEAYSSLEDAAAPSFLAGCLEICPEEPKPVAKSFMSILPSAEAAQTRGGKRPPCVDVDVNTCSSTWQAKTKLGRVATILRKSTFAPTWEVQLDGNANEEGGANAQRRMSLKDFAPGQNEILYNDPSKKQKTEEDTCATCQGRFGWGFGGTAIECKFCGLFYHKQCERDKRGIRGGGGGGFPSPYKCADCKEKHGIKVFDNNLQQGGSTLYGARPKQEMGRKIDAGFQAIHGARAEKSMKRLAAAVASKATWDSHVARRCFCGYPSCRVYTIGPLSFSSQMEGGDCKGLHVVLKEKMAASKGTAVLDVLRANVGDDPGLQLFIVAIEEKVLEWNECRKELRGGDVYRAMEIHSRGKHPYFATLAVHTHALALHHGWPVDMKHPYCIYGQELFNVLTSKEHDPGRRSGLMVTDNKVIVAERVELDRYIKEKVDMFTKWMNCEVEDLAFQLVDGFGRVSPWFVMGNCPDPTRAKNTAHHMVNEQSQPYLALVAAGKWTEFVAYDDPSTILTVLNNLLTIRGDPIKVRGTKNVCNGCANRWRWTVPGKTCTGAGGYCRNQLDYIWNKDFSYLGVNAIKIPADALLNFPDADLPEPTKEEIDLAKRTCQICKEKFKNAWFRGQHIFQGRYGATSACIAFGTSLREGDGY